MAHRSMLRSRKSVPLLCTAALVTGSTLAATPALANDGVDQPAASYSSTATPNSAIALTAPMGFNDWARFECSAQAPLPAMDGSTAQTAARSSKILHEAA